MVDTRAEAVQVRPRVVVDRFRGGMCVSLDVHANLRQTERDGLEGADGCR